MFYITLTNRVVGSGHNIKRSCAIKEPVFSTNSFKSSFTYAISSCLFKGSNSTISGLHLLNMKNYRLKKYTKINNESIVYP